MIKTKPKVIVLSGYGLNCEEETAYAFALAGAQPRIVHINDLIDGLVKLDKFQILAVPGGFAYGDDLGSGKAYANKLNNHLGEKLRKFAEADNLIIGICNGFQILTQTGLLPGALVFNDNARYTVRWVDLQVAETSPWLTGIDQLMLPIAHGEGKFFADTKTLNQLHKNNQIAVKYCKGEISTLQNLPANPNGSLENIAAVTNYDGRVLGLMPHPERAIFFTQLPHWTLLKEKLSRDGKKIPQYTQAFQIFKNAVGYFKY
jgi:phosphoribosylformylglycinamidine synthase